MAETFLELSLDDRRDALGVAADATGRPAHLLEKDVWVVWTLATLFASPLGEHLVFKGGTSLSKGYGVIRRFSEDVDLTYDIRALAPDLVGEDGEALPKSRSEERRWSKAVRHRLPDWVAEEVDPILSKAIADGSLAAKTRVDGDRLFVGYEAAAAGSGYVSPNVMLEFGARSTGEPASYRDVVCDAAESLDGVEFPVARPRVMHAERTFWEKATAIHVFCLQERLRGERFARHWHDRMKPGLPKQPSPIAISPTRSPHTNLCSSRRRPPMAPRSTMEPPSTAISTSFRTARHRRHSRTTTGEW